MRPEEFAHHLRRMREQIVGCDVNWEDPELYCDDSGERIESAYAEPEEASNGS